MGDEVILMEMGALLPCGRHRKSYMKELGGAQTMKTSFQNSKKNELTRACLRYLCASRVELVELLGSPVFFLK